MLVLWLARVPILIPVYVLLQGKITVGIHGTLSSYVPCENLSRDGQSAEKSPIESEVWREKVWKMSYEQILIENSI